MKYRVLQEYQGWRKGNNYMISNQTLASEVKVDTVSH